MNEQFGTNQGAVIRVRCSGIGYAGEILVPDLHIFRIFARL